MDLIDALLLTHSARFCHVLFAIVFEIIAKPFLRQKMRLLLLPLTLFPSLSQYSDYEQR